MEWQCFVRMRSNKRHLHLLHDLLLQHVAQFLASLGLLQLPDGPQQEGRHLQGAMPLAKPPPPAPLLPALGWPLQPSAAWLFGMFWLIAAVLFQ